MNLNPEPLELIKSGLKNIEMRLYDKKRRTILKGDIIIFTNAKDYNDKLKVKVLELHRFDSFDKLYKVFNKIQLGYSEMEVALPSDMESYYSKEDIEKYGVVGIEIELI